MINKKNDIKKTMLAYLAIAFSGIHFFITPVPQIVFVLLILFSIKFSVFYNKKFLTMIVVVLFLVILQAYIFSAFSAYEIISVLINSLFIGYIVFILLGEEFPKYYVKVLYIISIISLIFYIISLISPEFWNYIKTIPQKYEFLDTSERNNQFIIHSVSDGYDPFTGLLRHNGVFHEAGVYGLFLTIGIYFNYIYYKKMFNKYGIILIISLISTFSTAAFLGLSVLFLGFSFSLKKAKFLRFPTFIVLLVILINFFLNNPIMYKKIEYEYHRDMSKSMYRPTGGRIYGARKSFYVLSKHPFSGRGLTPSTRVEDPTSPEFIRYGILHEFAKVGIPAAIIYMILLIKGIRKYGRIYNENKITIFFIGALLINLLSQSFAYTPVIMNFVFWGIYAKKHTNNIISAEADTKKYLTTSKKKTI